ncbi:MAG TPA: hypothetical protein VII06_07845 [Chloroflexota bacterium]|jgi:hypothetical protein
MRPAFSLLAALGLTMTTLWAPISRAQGIAPDEAAISAQGDGEDRGGGAAPRGEGPRGEGPRAEAARATMAAARMSSTEFPLIRGYVVLQRTGANRTAVTVTVFGLEPGSTHVNHIHGGSCSGSILFPLGDLVADETGVARSVSSVAGALNVENWWVNVHAGPSLPSPGITCGKVEGPPPARTRPAPGPSPSPAPRPDGGDRPAPGGTSSGGDRSGPPSGAPPPAPSATPERR